MANLHASHLIQIKFGPLHHTMAGQPKKLTSINAPAPRIDYPNLQYKAEAFLNKFARNRIRKIMAKESSPTNTQLPEIPLPGWLSNQVLSPDALTPSMRHAFAARRKVIDEIEDFADAWIERHRNANAEVISECLKASNGAGQPMGVLNTWAMNSARVAAEDMSSAMNFWMNCARHCMSEAQPALEETAQEARDRIVALSPRKG